MNSTSDRLALHQRMDFDPTWFLVSLLVSTAGFVAFMYGRKMKRLPQMLAGIALMVFPYFVSNIWLMLGISVAITVGMFGAIRAGM
jgi:hypothetical protein